MHASWLNRIEIYFSIPTRKALAGESFDDPDTLTDRIQAFEQRHRGRDTRNELNSYLTKLTDPRRTYEHAH